MKDVATKHQGNTSSQVPISQHPVFPAIVSLWFAALLGIGSLLLPVTLFEALADTTGIASVIPAAEPPLGVSARILIALVAAGLGVAAGLLIARQVAAAQGATHRAPQRQPQSAKRPISAHEELGAESFDEPVEADVEAPRPAPIPGRRRALAVTEESGPSALLDCAPLPGADTEVALATDEPAEAEPLDLHAFAEDIAEPTDAEEADFTADIAFDPAPAAARLFDEPGEAEAYEADEGDDDDAPFHALRQAMLATTEETPAAPPAATEGEPAPLAELSISELVDRFALSLQRAAARAEAEALAQAEAAMEPEPAFDEAPARYVPDLGVEAMEAPRLDLAPPRFEAEPEPVEAEAVPAALRPIALEEEHGEDEHDDLELTLSLEPEARPFSRPLADDDAADDAADEDDDGEGYSSLLTMRTPQREFVRIDEDEAAEEAIEPVVVFPGQDQRRATPAAENSPEFAETRPFDSPRAGRQPVDQAQAERALRDALHKLQRLSGAA